MDLFLVIIDTLVILSYILLIALISPHIMRVIKNRNYDIFFQLLPVLAIIFVSGVAICVGYGGFQETLFFRLTTIISFLLLLSLLFLTFIMKKRWKDNYDKIITWIFSFQLKEIRFPKTR
ncbi:putative membrane protein (GlpM family) [Sporosarcina sp. JAI121]|nr:putative membrane protein (GlpM family) [Sporosarcina sp. JAI121]